MKKLMIAVAVAATGLVASAALNLAYDFSASVKTTTGRKGSVQSQSYTVKLGKNAAGAFWYNDASITMTADGKYGYWREGGLPTGTAHTNVAYVTTDGWPVGTLINMNQLSDDLKKDFASQLGFNQTTKQSNYPLMSAGVFCKTFSYVDRQSAECYRVASSKTIKARVDAKADCCTTGTATPNWDIYDWDTTEAEFKAATAAKKWAESVTHVMFNKFGAQTFEKLNKVEWMGTVSGGATATAYGEANYFALAGQGNYGKLGVDTSATPNATVNGANSISGNIVGALPGSTCEYCCQPDTFAKFWICAGTAATGEVKLTLDANPTSATFGQFLDSTGTPTLPSAAGYETAAFGTFTLKLNKKYSTDLK